MHVRHLRTLFVIATSVAAVALAPAASARPASPVERQIAWALSEVDGRGATLTEAEVADHFAPSFLARLPTPVVVQAMKSTIALGPFRRQGYAGKPSRTSAILRVETRTHQKLALYATVEPRPPYRLTGFEITDRPGRGAAEIATKGRYTGAFSIGNGRRLFLDCTGTGPVTVILEAGAGAGASSWQRVQTPLARTTRVCSYDRANLPGGSSDPAPKPQTAADVVRDLHRALVAARVPKPYVLAGHSNGGLFARLYATTYPDDVRGLVLVDAVSEETPQRERTLLKQLMTAAQWRDYRRSLAHRPPFVPYVGDEQVDMDRSYVQLKTAAPLRDMPLVVISHGIPDPMPHEELKGLRDGRERIWQAMQRDLTTLVPGAVRVVATHSHHQIPAEEPELVVRELERVVAEVR